MKKYIIVLCFIFFHKIGYVQTYYPFPQSDNTIWSTVLHSSCYPNSIILYYFLHGDTIINNVLYHKLYVNNTDTFNVYANYYGAIKDTNRYIVYVYYDYTIDSIGYDTLYNFNNINIGDTIKYFYLPYDEPGHAYYNECYFYVLDSIDMVHVEDGTFRKRYNFTNVNFPCYFEYLAPLYEAWIEGIGSIHGILYPACIAVMECGFSADFLLCLRVNDSLIYKDPWQPYCDSLTHIKDEDIFEIEIYPNPANERIVIKFSNTNYLNMFTIRINDIFGKILLQKNAQNTSVIDISHLPDGIYFVSVQSDNNHFQKKFIKIKQ